MARRSVLAALALVVAAVAAGPAHAAQWRPGACGLPTALPLHVEYAEAGVSPTVRNEIFGPARPPLVLATSGIKVPAQLRAAGAHTIYWKMKLAPFVGSADFPADPATIPAAARRLFDTAAAESACATPSIALNELAGAYLSTPWTPTYAEYRANVLALLQNLRALGAHPYLLVTTSPRPFTESPDVIDWWRAAASVSDIVLEMHFNGRVVAADGPIAGGRRRRAAMRRAIAQFAALGIAPQQLGLLHGFQSGPGAGGRERLPLTKWLRVVKWETLAAQQVANELAGAGTPLGSDWSWGWGDFLVLSPLDPDKPITACVYLWTRDPALCDGPGRAAAAGVAFNTSRTEGQLLFPAGVQCTVTSPRAAIATADIDRLAQVQTDAGTPLGRPAALSLLFDRLVERRRAIAYGGEIARVERQVVAQRFAGSWDGYAQTLQARGIAPDIARSLLGDQVRRRKISAQLRRRPGGFGGWASSRLASTLKTTTCVNDELPAATPVDPIAQLGFLRLPPATRRR